MSTPYAYFHKQIVPLSEAKIGIMTHAFNYGTGVFEGIRGNWNADDNTIYLFKVEEHLKRLRQSARICRIEISETDAQLSELIKQVVCKSEIGEDQSVRPLAYKSSEVRDNCLKRFCQIQFSEHLRRHLPGIGCRGARVQTS